MIRDALVKQFQQMLGKQNVLQDEADLHSYSYDAAVLNPSSPSIVLRPANSEALGKAVRLCNENGLPLTVRGAPAPTFPAEPYQHRAAW